ncbi:mucin-21 [Prorops nasuta]|uniref:mucin-21 n=1 Tax=Prorops nasuta TaxID=863751 RepID=UPI0034CF59A2
MVEETEEERRMYGGRVDRENNNATQQQQSHQPWMVRAEVTIRHGSPVVPGAEQVPTGRPSGTTDPAGVRMTYRWSNQAAPTSFRSSSPSSSFGFRRGNILFTSTPPSRSAFPATPTRSESPANDDSQSSRSRRGLNLNDSGYNSEQFSPRTQVNLPRRSSTLQCDRRCKSTCSIVLSNVAANDDKKTEGTSVGSQDGKDTSRDPASLGYSYPPHHVSARCHFSTVPEVCEDCLETGSSSTGFSTHFCTRVPERTSNKSTSISKDASSQTTDIESRNSSSTLNSFKGRRKIAAGSRHSDERRRRAKENPVANLPPEARSRASSNQDKSDSSKDDGSQRKSRTVHIDVYCTGTEEDESTDASTNTEDEHTTPTTVFENEDVRVTHNTPTKSNLPRGFTDDKAFLKRAVERRCESFRHAPMRMPSLSSSKGYESDDVLSSLYPSQFSSYSALRDLDSVAWSAASSSAAMAAEDNESTIATSSKDTFSDIESLLSTKSGLTPCDSFEYANSSDKDRIQKMDTFWEKSAKEREAKGKTWRSPQIERKHLLQNRKMRDYLKEHDIGWSSGSESLGSSDESGTMAWSFVSSDDGSQLARKATTFRPWSKDRDKSKAEAPVTKPLADSSPVHLEEHHSDSTTHSDLPNFSHSPQTGPFSKSPSPVPSKFPSRVTSPFTTPQGEKTDHIMKASIFGAVIDAFRKPGHHIGPSKNPSCSCEHCRRYFEENDLRGRTRSLSEFERRLGPLFRRNRDIRSDPPSRKD